MFLRTLLAACAAFCLMPLPGSAQTETEATPLCHALYSAESRLCFEPSGVGNNYDLGYIRCFWEVDPAFLYINGAVTTHFKTLTGNFNQIEFDFGQNMLVDSIRYHSAALNYTQTPEDILRIYLPVPLAAGAYDSLTVYYQGAPETGQGFGTFKASTHNNTPVIWTLSEPYGAKEWWPCKQSLSDKADSVDIRVTVPLAYKVAANGALQSITPTPAGDRHTYHWHSRYPIAAYLVAFAATDYEIYSDYVPYPGGQIEVLNYVYPEYLPTAQAISDNVVEIMQLFNDRAGLYPFHQEKYGHAQFGFGGGMEHQTMSFMANLNYGLTAHELAHQWFGDKVTCGSWQDIWLNEGFATYFEGLTKEAYYPATDWYNWKSGKRGSIISQPDGSVFCPDTTDIYRVFNSRLTYNKGAYVLHMLRWVLGDDAFFQGIRNYLNDPAHAYGYARTPDLQAHLETAGGQDLDLFFAQWVYGEGFPTYHLYWTHDNGYLNGYIEQTTSKPESVPYFDILPIPLRVHGAGGEDTTVLYYGAMGFYIPFQIDTVEIDPDLWILSGWNSTTHVIEGTKNALFDFGLRAWPNPAAERLLVSGETLPADARLRLSNSLGATVLETDAPRSADRWEQNLDIRVLPPGVYFLQIASEGLHSRPLRVVKL